MTFASANKTFLFVYSGDSTDTSTEIPAASAIQAVSVDEDAVVSIGFTDGDTDAVFPTTNGEQGQGTFLPQNVPVTISVPQAASTSTMFVSVAGPVAGNVFVTLGAIS